MFLKMHQLRLDDFKCSEQVKPRSRLDQERSFIPSQIPRSNGEESELPWILHGHSHRLSSKGHDLSKDVTLLVSTNFDCILAWKQPHATTASSVETLSHKADRGSDHVSKVPVELRFLASEEDQVG